MGGVQPVWQHVDKVDPNEKGPNFHLRCKWCIAGMHQLATVQHGSVLKTCKASVQRIRASYRICHQRIVPRIVSHRIRIVFPHH